MTATQSNTENETNKRFFLAIGIVGVSLLGLVIIAGMAIKYAASGEEGKTATTIFNATLPLIGTWVGTILAFYFSGDAYNKASDNMRQLVERVTPQSTPPSTPVKDAMRPLDKMIKLVFTQTAKDGDYNLKEGILKLFGPPATRLPVINADSTLRYLIHEAPVHKFLARLTLPNNAGVKPDAATLADLVADAEIGKMIAPAAMAFVKPDATVADAKAAMEAVKALPKCQDVFVTEDGTAKGKVLGWLSNTKVSEKTPASG